MSVASVQRGESQLLALFLLAVVVVIVLYLFATGELVMTQPVAV